MGAIWASIQRQVPLEEVLRRGLGIIFVIAIAWLAYWLLRRALMGAMRATAGRVEDSAHRQRITTLVLLVGSIAKYVVIFVAAVVILQRLGIDPTPVLAGAGVVGLAVGFGAQNLVRDVVSGFFIIMEGQYAVGDLVEINGVFGRVEEVGLRVTRLRDPSGQLRYFPNGGITTANNYVERYIAYLLSVPFASPEPAGAAALVRVALEDFDREFQVFAQPPVLGAMEDLPTYARVLRAEIRTLPGRQLIVEQKLAARLTAGLERAGHALPAGADIGLALRPLPPAS